MSHREGVLKSLDTKFLQRLKTNANVSREEDRRRIIDDLRNRCVNEEGGGSQREFSRVFMHGDSIVDVPPDLHTNWSVMLRPEGERCLAILSRGSILTLRGRNGNVLKTIVLPFFSLDTGVFDCVLGFDESKMKQTLYVFDIVFMNKNELCMASFDCRQFWLKSNWPFGQSPQLDEVDVPQIVLLESRSATAENISTLYHSSPPFATDSLVFYNNASKYEFGLSDQMLVFRDASLSPYAIDTVDAFEVVLNAKRSGLYTWDGFALSGEPYTGKQGLVRARVNPQFEFTTIGPSRKPFAFSMNRIIDQARKRIAKGQILVSNNQGLHAILHTDPVSIDLLVSC